MYKMPKPNERFGFIQALRKPRLSFRFIKSSCFELLNLQYLKTPSKYDDKSAQKLLDLRLARFARNI